MDNKIYPTMVIRSQAEVIELLEKENQKYKEVIDKANNKLNNMFNEGNENKVLDDLLELGKILEMK